MSGKSEQVDQFSTERQAITAATGVLDGFDTDTAASSNEFESAEMLLRKTADPVAAIDMSDDTKRAAQQRFLAARKAVAKVEADRAAFPHTRESLAARSKLLGEQEADARNDRVRAAHKIDLGEMVHLGLALEACQSRILDRARQNPDSQLPDYSVTFPVGIFDLVPVTDHMNVLRKMVWRDHVLLGIIEFDPSLVDPAVAGPILDAIAERKQRGAPRWYAVPGNSFDIYPTKRS